MAVNLTPQYHRAQEEYRRAQTLEDELRWLEVMWKELPKHKASEKVQSDLKQKISRAKADLETQRTKKAAPVGVSIPRQGAGTAILIGGPNAGKSRLLAAVTRATPEVAPYPFTTRTPLPGMMPWEDVMVQLLDTPPITADMCEPYMLNLIRGADVAVLLVDLGDDDGIEQVQAVLHRLQPGKTRLARDTKLDEDDVGIAYTRTLLVPNKLDLPDAPTRLELLHELCPLDFDEFPISAETGVGLDALKTAIYQSLDVIRVYSKLPRAKTADFERPFTLPRGSTVIDLAEAIHRDFVEGFKFAKVWGTGVHDGTQVRGDHVLHDRDIVEVHVAGA